MKPRLGFISLIAVLLASGIYCCSLYSHSRLNRAQIEMLQEQLAEFGQVRAQNQALRILLAQLDELEALRKDNAELLRIRHEILELQATADKRKLAAARSREGQVLQLQTDNLQLRLENEQLEQAPQIVSARQQVDVDELAQIGDALRLYAKMNDNNLPGQFAELRHYTTADIFPTLETNRFEFLYQGKLTSISD